MVKNFLRTEGSFEKTCFKTGFCIKGKYTKYIFEYITLLEKYPTFSFCENLVDFNEAHLHHVTLNFHTHAWISSCLSMASTIWVSLELSSNNWFQIISTHPGHAGLHKQWPRLHEYYNHWRCVLGVCIWPGTVIFLMMKIQQED